MIAATLFEPVSGTSGWIPRIAVKRTSKDTDHASLHLRIASIGAVLAVMIALIAIVLL